jgi:hypothetical protein
MVSNAGFEKPARRSASFDLQRNLGLGPSRPNRRQGFERRRRQHPGRPPHDLDFAVVLDHPGGFDDAFGGHEASRDERLQPVNRSRVMTAPSTPTAAPSPRPFGGDALFNRARRELDAEVAQPVTAAARSFAIVM